MDLNVDIKDLKEPIMKFVKNLGKKDSDNNPEASESVGDADKSTSKKQSDLVKKLLKPLNKVLASYSFKNEKILGVDITPHYIRVCQMRESYGKWSLNNLASSCMENQFRNMDIHTQPDIYISNLKELVKKNKISTKNVAFSVPSESSIVKVLNIPAMDDEDFKQAAELGGIWESMVALEGGAANYSIYYKILERYDEVIVEFDEAQESVEQVPEQPIQQMPEQQPMADIAMQENVEIQQGQPQQVADIPVENIPNTIAAEAQSQDQILQAPLEVQPEAQMEAQPEQLDAQEQVVQNNEEQVVQAQPIENIVENSHAQENFIEQPQQPVQEIQPEQQAEVAQTVDLNIQPQEQPMTEQSAGETADALANAFNQMDPNNPFGTQEQAPAEQVQTEIAPDVPADIPVDANMQQTDIAPDMQAQQQVGIEQPIAQEFQEIPTQQVAQEAMEQVAPQPIEPQPQNIPASMDVLFVATKLSEIQAHENIIKQAGLNPVLADIRFLALNHALENDSKKMEDVSRPYAFLEFGADDNYLFVVDGKNTQNYNIYMSEDDKNNIIYNAQNPDSINAFVQNYASQLQQLLSSHETTYNSGAIRNIFVSSSAPLHVDDASTPPIIKTFVSNISTMFGDRKITECNFCDYVDVPEKFAKQVNAEGNIAAWASTVGIASRKLDIFSFEKGKHALSRINLLPKIKLEKKNKRISVLSTLAALVALGGVGFLMFGNYASVQIENNNVKEEVQSLAGIEQTHDTIKIEAQKLTISMRKVNSLGDIQESLPSNQKSILAAYGHITSVIPEGVWLEEVSYSLPDNVEIKGTSLSDSSILDFVENLNKGKNFKRVALKTMETKKQSEMKNIDMSQMPPDAQFKNFTLEGMVMDSAVMQSMEILSEGAKNGN